MITIKSAREIELMKNAGNILAKTRELLVPHIKPGVTTHELDVLADKFIRDLGAIPSFKDYNGFPGSICASVNDVLVHGIPSKDVVLKDGDVITLDIGACYKGYHGDSAWSYFVGTPSEEAKRIMEVTEQSLYEGSDKYKKFKNNY